MEVLIDEIILKIYFKECKTGFERRRLVPFLSVPVHLGPFLSIPVDSVTPF